MGKSAIVTMVVGDRFRELWSRFCAPSWQVYAQRNGFDLLVIDRPLDTRDIATRRGFSWQKLLIGRVEAVAPYDTLIWIDADIVINAAVAPNILDGTPADRIGAVRYHPLLRQPLFAAAHARLTGGLTPEAASAAIFRQFGLAGEHGHMIQGGVLTIPRHHLPFLEQIYLRYPTPGSEQQQEQPFLSYELSTAGLTHFLDDKFNAVWYEYKHGVYFGDNQDSVNRAVLRRLVSEVYFLHFAGNQQDMLLLDD